MSSLAWLIIYVVLMTLIGIVLYLVWIKHYYWTKKQKDRRRDEGKSDWLD